MVHNDLSLSSHQFCLFLMGGPQASTVLIEQREAASYSLALFSWESLTPLMMVVIAGKAHRAGLVERCYGWQQKLTNRTSADQRSCGSA